MNQTSAPDPDAPYALSSPAERTRRSALLSEPHIQPLTHYRETLRSATRMSSNIPSFDPLDGGVKARVLLLLEAPGPKACESGFVSRNNPDPTARNLCELLAGAGIPRQETLLWNIVPWYVGEPGKIRGVNAADLQLALLHLPSLLALLPDLQVIVLVGKKAQSARADIQRISAVSIEDIPHPSARVWNTRKGARERAEATLVRIGTILAAGRFTPDINKVQFFCARSD